jgi:hypothetical protein
MSLRSDVVSPGDWLSSIWFLLSTGLVVIGRWGNSGSSCRVVRAVVVFTKWQLQVAFQLQLCLAISSPSEVGQFSFECCSLSHYLPHFGRLACCSTPLSAFVALPTFLYWEFSSLPHPHSLGQVQHSTPTSSVSARLQFTVYAFQLCWGRFSLHRGCAG